MNAACVFLPLCAAFANAGSAWADAIPTYAATTASITWQTRLGVVLYSFRGPGVDLSDANYFDPTTYYLLGSLPHTYIFFSRIAPDGNSSDDPWNFDGNTDNLRSEAVQSDWGWSIVFCGVQYSGPVDVHSREVALHRRALSGFSPVHDRSRSRCRRPARTWNFRPYLPAQISTAITYLGGI